LRFDETHFRELISGERRGAAAGLLRCGLSGLAYGYRLGVGARNWAFDHGWKRVHHAAVPVVAVGNITTGGSGKTPFVAFLAGWFRERGVRVAVVSRGYRSLDGAANDEKLILDQLCPDVPHVQNPDRVAAVRVACEEHQAQLVILDDGFQHRRLARDLDIVLIDATNPWGYGRLLPRGLLREPLSALKRADLVVLTRADQCSDEARAAIINRLTAERSDPACVEVAFSPTRLRSSSGKNSAISSLAGKSAAAFCGIGNPESFRRILLECGVELRWFQQFADHHHYTAKDLVELGRHAAEANAAVVLTTHKDLVKIPQDALAGRPLWAVEIGTRIVRNEELLSQHLQNVLATLQVPTS
jgi:tetraacyldisaccharide 4'-kinase